MKSIAHLVTSRQQLRGLLRCGPLVVSRSWDRLGPMPEFVETPAVEFTTGGESYLVCTSLDELRRIAGLIEKEEKRKRNGAPATHNR